MVETGIEKGGYIVLLRCEWLFFVRLSTEELFFNSSSVILKLKLEFLSMHFRRVPSLWSLPASNSFHIVDGLRHLPPLGLWQEPSEAGGHQAEGHEDDGRDSGVDVCQGGHRGRQGTADLADEGGGTDTGSTYSCRHDLSCVHVEDSEAESSREVSDQSKDDNWPVAGEYVTRDE